MLDLSAHWRHPSTPTEPCGLFHLLLQIAAADPKQFETQPEPEETAADAKTPQVRLLLRHSAALPASVCRVPCGAGCCMPAAGMQLARPCAIVAPPPA